MVVYGEGRYPAAEHGTVRPRPRRPSRPGGRPVRPACPDCGLRRWRRSWCPRTPRWSRAARTRRANSPRSTWPPRGPGRPVARLGVALPQRLRPPDAPRHPVRRGGLDLPLGAGARRGARVLEDGRQRRDFVHVTDVARANVLALTADARGGPRWLRGERLLRRAAHRRRPGRRRWPRRWAARAAGGRRRPARRRAARGRRPCEAVATLGFRARVVRRRRSGVRHRPAPLSLPNPRSRRQRQAYLEPAAGPRFAASIRPWCASTRPRAIASPSAAAARRSARSGSGARRRPGTRPRRRG